MTEKPTKCRACGGRGYHRCECWPGDCVCGYGDETCEECAGDGYIDPSYDDLSQVFESPAPSPRARGTSE